MNEDEKTIFNVRKLFPEVSRRMQILEHLRRTWPSVAGPAGRHSFPYDLIINDLYVAAENNHTAQIIANMKGNISRVFANRYDYKDKVNVKITIGKPPEHKAKTRPAHDNNNNNKTEQAVEVEVDENLVNEYISECPDSMSDDAKFAISHLRAYLESLRP